MTHPTHGVIFLLHVSGTSPHAVNEWRTYRTLPAAKAQATRSTMYWDGSPAGDFSARILVLDTENLTITELP